MFNQLQQFPGSGISRNDPESGKWFLGSNSLSKQFHVDQRKKCILSTIEIYKNSLKVWKKHQTTYKIVVNHSSDSYDWKLVSDNMWYVRWKLFSEGESNGRTGIREFPGSLYGNTGKQAGIAARLYLCCLNYLLTRIQHELRSNLNNIHTNKKCKNFNAICFQKKKRRLLSNRI